MTTKDAAKLLGVTSTTLLKYVKDDRFPSPETEWHGRQKSFIWTDELVATYRGIIEGLRR